MKANPGHTDAFVAVDCRNQKLRTQRWKTREALIITIFNTVIHYDIDS